MNLRNEILREHSKAQKDKIVSWIGNHQNRFDELFSLFLKDEYRVVQRAAWPLSDAVLAHPRLITRHLSKLVQQLERKDTHEAVKRNVLRILQDTPLPQRLQGKVMNACFDYLTDPMEKPAIQAYALTVLQHLCRLYPEIREEIALIIEEKKETASPAFRVRARRFLKEFGSVNY